jgi:hypothetical protein
VPLTVIDAYIHANGILTIGMEPLQHGLKGGTEQRTLGMLLSVGPNGLILVGQLCMLG